MSRSAPIGVFDSGLGGLTIVREIRKKFPRESIIYFGDIARLPYGIKSRNQIIRYSVQNTKFLKKKKVKAVIIACNSSASAATLSLRKRFRLPIIDVIAPAVREAVRFSKKKRIGVIATEATIQSQSYQKLIVKSDSQQKVFTKACPLLVPFVEEGRLSGPVVEEVIRGYLRPLLMKKIDVLILGCTHYPILRRAIQKVAGKKVRLVDSASPTAKELAGLLAERNLARKSRRKGKLRVYVSDKPQNFIRVSEKFIRESLTSVKLVRN